MTSPLAGLSWFTFQGSVDGLKWDTIGKHLNDDSIAEPFGSATWTIPRTKAYRYFQVQQLDRNDGGTFFLSLSGIELFGTLYGNQFLCLA